MPARKNKKSPRSIRYLLYTDKRFQRISVRRISERLKKARQARRSARRKSSASAGGAFLWAPSPRALVAGTACVLAAVAFVAARQPVAESELDRVRQAAPEPNVVAMESALMPTQRARPEPRGPAPEKPAMAQTPAATRTPATAEAPAATRTVAATRISDAGPQARVAETATATAKPPAAESRGELAAAMAKAPAETPGGSAATITGCLDQDDNTFWLRNTSGDDAPKSRSWRSGFLRRSSASVEIVDAGNTLRLSSYVGQRVAASGTIVNREMQARSVRRLAASCS